jgi:hypothetical protein
VEKGLDIDLDFEAAVEMPLVRADKTRTYVPRSWSSDSSYHMSTARSTGVMRS